MIAVLRPPKGKGPFPVVITLHGGSGLLGGTIEHGARLACAGFVVVVGCWLDNHPGDPMWCPTAPFPPIAIANMQTVARVLPGVRRNRVGVVGYSDGTDPLFNLPWGPWVHALVADSGVAFNQATREFSVHAAAPVLLLCGTTDPNCQLMHQFEAALRANGATVESQYYPGGNHVVTISDQPATIRDDANARLIKFLNNELKS